MIEHPIHDHPSAVSRTGGAVLALGTLCYAVTVVAYVVLYVTSHAPDATLASKLLT